MALKMKKYPLLISVVISCVIIIASLFVLGFKGMNLGVSLGGGTQIEITMKDGLLTSDYTSTVKDVLKKYNLKIDSNFVEDKYTATENNSEYNKKCLIVQVAKTVDEEKAASIKADLLAAISKDDSSANENYISVEKITSSVLSKSVLRIAYAFGIIAVCFFVFGLIRYDVFAGISFIIAFLHNIILYLSLVILTRVQLTISSISVLIFLTLVMSIVLISIYEKFRETSALKESAKTPISERMINSEKEIVKPFSIIVVAIVIFTVALLFVATSRINIIAINIMMALVVSLYTSLLIGPSSYVALLDIREMNRKAVLSRNDTINKSIRKKIKKSQQNKGSRVK